MAVAQSTGWTLEPAGSVRKLDCGFNTTNCSGQYIAGSIYDSGGGSIISDASAPVSPNNVLRAILPLGQTVGGDQFEWWDSATGQELYVGTYARINANYSCSSVSSTKFSFMRAFENKGAGTQLNGTFIFEGCGDSRTMTFHHNTGGLNNGHVCGGDAQGATCFPNVGPGQIVRGQWFKLEACIRASTTSTSQNAIVWWAINGVMAGRYTNLNYGGPVVNEAVFNQTWDGAGNGQGFTTDSIIDLDHMVVSVPPNGGCASVVGGVTDTTPPSNVTGVTASSPQPTSAVLNWSAATDNVAVAGYNIERCQGSGCTNFSSVGQFGPSVTYTDATLSPGLPYSYRMKARDTSGNVSISYSSIVSITTPSATLPSIVSASTSVTGAVITWSGSPASIRVQTDTLNIVEPISAFSGSTLTPAHVQSASASGSGSSASKSFTSSVSAGSALIARYKGDAGVTVTGITDSLGNTWMQIPGATTSGGGGGGGTVTTTASVDFTGTQGTNGWSYKSSDGSNLTWNGSYWAGTDYYISIWEDGMTPGNSTDAVRRYTVPISGAVSITGNAHDVGGGCGFNAVVSIVKNGVTIWTQTIATGDTTGYNFNLSDSVVAGDTLDFVLNKGLGYSCDSTQFDPTITITPSGSSGYQTMWIATNSVAGPNTVTAALSGSSSYEFDIIEYSGVATTSPVDQSKTATLTDPGTGSNAVTSGTVTTTTNGQLIVSAASRVGGSGSTTSAGTGYTIRQNALGHSPIEDKIQASAGAVAGTFTASNAADDFIVSLITLKAQTSSANYSRVWPLGTTFACFYPRDAAGNENNVSPGYKCAAVVTTADTTPPVRSNPQPTGTLAFGTTSATISVTIDEASTCKFGSSAGVAYASQPNTMTTNGLTASATLTGLTNGAAITRYVRCQDAFGNANTTDTTISFSVAASASDTTAPSQVTGLTGTALSSTQVGLSWNAATDNVAVTGYQVYVCAPGCVTYSLAGTTAGTTFSASGLNPGGTYFFKVRSFDAVLNFGTDSAFIVVTLPSGDSTPPSNVNNLASSVEDFQTINLSWDAGTDNVAVTGTIIEQCEGAACTAFKLIATITDSASRTLRVASLYPKTTYRFRAKHFDSAGNVSVEYATVSETTIDVPPGTVLGICPCRQKR